MPPRLTPQTMPVELERIGGRGDFFDELHAGRGMVINGEITRFESSRVELDHGKTLAEDMAIFATVWHQ